MKTLFAIALLLAVGACGAAETPDQAYVRLTSSYQTAATAAVTYGNLPRCMPEGGPIVCSQQKVVDQIKKASTVSITAIEQATDILKDPALTSGTKETAISAANAAIATFGSIVATYEVK